MRLTNTINRTINASPSSTFATTAMCKTHYDCSTITRSIGEMCSPSVPTLCTTISTTLTWRTKRVTKTLGTCLDNTTGVFPTNGRLWVPCVMTISQMVRSRTLRQNSMSATNLSTISQFVLDMQCGNLWHEGCRGSGWSRRQGDNIRRYGTQGEKRQCRGCDNDTDAGRLLHRAYSRNSKECDSDVRALVHNTERVPYN